MECWEQNVKMNNLKQEWNGLNRMERLEMEWIPTKWNVGKQNVRWNALDQDGMVWNRMVGTVSAGPVAKGG